MKRNLLLMLLLCIFIFSACAKDQSDNLTWKDIIGEDYKITEEIISAPEIDEQGNEVSVDNTNNIDRSIISEDIYQIEIPHDKLKVISAADTVELWCDSLKKCDWEQIYLISYGLNGMIINAEYDNDNSMDFFFSTIRWRIIETIEQGDTATCRVEISTPDLFQIFNDYLMIQSSFDDLDEKQIVDDLKFLIKSSVLKEEIIDIQLIKETGYWKIILDESLLKSSTGGLSDFYHQQSIDIFQEATNK